MMKKHERNAREYSLQMYLYTCNRFVLLSEKRRKE